jgi:hypothetical protein
MLRIWALRPLCLILDEQWAASTLAFVINGPFREWLMPLSRRFLNEV